MASLDGVIEKYTNIEKAIENAMRNEVADVVRETIAQTARKYVYGKYSAPVFRSRRGDPQGDLYGRTTGGITDPNSVVIEVNGTELVAKDNPDWQQLWGGGGTGVGSWRPEKRLAEAIAEGDSRYNMQEAGPRPFHDKAKEELISSGSVEAALRRGLRRQGITVGKIIIT